jgi:hypothetical protein
VVVSIVDNSDEDWSFGQGRAQFLSCFSRTWSPILNLASSCMATFRFLGG